MNKINFLGLNLLNSTLQEVMNEVKFILNSSVVKVFFTPNPEMFVECRRNPSFFEVLSTADYLLPDGIGITLWSKFLSKGKLKSRITGVDFMQSILENNHGKVFLLGGEKGAAKKVAKMYPNVVGYFDGIVNSDNFNSIANQINESSANIVFVALGAPKQEFWINEHSSKFNNVRIFAGVGGAVDFLAGIQLRAPKLFRRLGIEWLWRLFCDPSRINRIWKAVFVFSWICFDSLKSKK